ncbi:MULTISPECIES: DNA polymerase III subunit delta' [Arcobacteraceae]|uniref:DNA polymerase III subunit delta n=4 Tax=Arcobacteraceae TaxID=2808963 RepID=A0AAP4PRX3_9BACT|nr:MULTISPECIES: DNA polymerase III subunit delta' [Arcobacteraceae]MCP3648876.1 DNA polymerase III subunit delta' [Arcobacter sp. DNRA7]KLD97437.1 DNA polymerase III subunit delta' [Aliarcobacter butzleri L349]KLE01463.1 DNA polymerase III subunit delta' [Aliarcobacter butzleri L351]KLE10845.1 DNA polymerase III subunit delta' [Aliarcobacter butzleri L355]KLE13216.1 DNA polymerase III subunit delta' [Aliarcobacter butzleri L350]
MLDFIENSSILIVNNIEETLNLMLPKYPLHSVRVIKNEEKEEFLIAQANETIKEAFIATSEKKYLFLCGSTFRKEAQNALLKILEEPPRNIVFILITNSKTSLLPTIYSRLPYKYLKKSEQKIESSLDLNRLDLKDIYTFLQENQKISKQEAKDIVESLLLKANNQKIKLSQKKLDFFSKAIKLLELNSKPINVLTTLLLYLSNQKNQN